MKQIHKVNRKGKRAVHKKRKRGKWSEHFVQTTTYSHKRQLLLQLESHNRNVVAFFVPRSRTPRLLCPPDIAAVWCLVKVAEVRKLPLQPTPIQRSSRRCSLVASVKVAKDRRPFANKSTFLIRKYPTHPTRLLYQKKWDCQGFYFIFFALFGLTYGTKWDTLTRPNKNGRIKNADSTNNK